jgi:uncharacterized RmlC-like cupin family protein
LLVVKPNLDAEAKRHELTPGDFAFVPPWTEHQMVNESDEKVVWVVMQSGHHPIVVDLTEWGGDQQR